MQFTENQKCDLIYPLSIRY